ncbi:MAG: hypothetical protein UY85_C0023G0001, partial [Candidatus Peribacteria bacterium GW2011_GWB1_54_5]
MDHFDLLMISIDRNIYQPVFGQIVQGRDQRKEVVIAPINNFFGQIFYGNRKRKLFLFGQFFQLPPK